MVGSCQSVGLARQRLRPAGYYLAATHLEHTVGMWAHY